MQEPQSLTMNGMSEEESRLQIEDDARASAIQEQRRKDEAEEIAAELYGELGLRKGRRLRKEQEWRAAIAQYNGKYSAEKLKDLDEKGGCALFLNFTRPKTDAFSANLSEMLLPTDDKNWGISPTPIAKLSQLAASTVEIDKTDQGHPVLASDMADAIQKVAKERCEGMERQIDDYLTECDYNAEQRDGIEMGMMLGTIIMRGPTKAAASSMEWEKVEDPQTKQTTWMLVPDVREERPSACAVDPHHFYPDDTAMSADVQACESIFETFFFTKKRLRAMAKSGFDAEVIKEAIEQEASQLPSWYINLKADNEDTTTSGHGLYEVWLWSGDLAKEKLAALGLPQEAVDTLDETLDTYPAQVWGIGPKPLKVSLNPSDTGDLPYSAMQVFADPTNFFGHGVPWVAENAQEAINGVWRMLHDNAGLSVGPQCAVNKAMIQGSDGDYQMKPRKTWYVNNPDDSDAKVDVREAIQFFAVDAHMQELTLLLKLVTEMLNQELNFSLLMQGGTNENTPDTKGATQIVYNTGRVVIRRVVKRYDDDITNPLIKRFYHWEMQHGTDEEIKGDYCIEAKGSGVLMERQEQLQAMNQAASVALAPQYAHIIDQDSFIEQYMKNLRLTGVLRNETDRAKKLKEMQQAQQGQPQGDPARMMLAQIAAKRLELDAQEAQARLQLDTQIHQDDLMLESKKLLLDTHATGANADANQQRLGIDKQKIGLGAQKLDSDNKRFNTEVAVKQQQGSGI